MKIAVTSPSFSSNATLKSELLAILPNSKLNLNGVRFQKQELIEYLQDADAAIIGLEAIDDEVLSCCKNLKIIAKYGVGLDNIDIDACNKRGVAIGWSGGVNKLSVAEMTIGYMLMLLRNLYITSNLLKNGVWNKNGGMQLSGKTVGIIGFGYIGQEVARLLQPFGCEILVNDIENKMDEIKRYGGVYQEKDYIFKNADIITIHTPLTSLTSNMINENVFALMKSSAFIINTARGGIVNEDDLKKALKNADIAGAALDVYMDEPPKDTELLALPNLVCTPHIGGNSAEAILAMGRSAIKHIKEYFKV